MILIGLKKTLLKMKKQTKDIIIAIVGAIAIAALFAALALLCSY